MLIGINGYAGSGKDTVGKIIQYLLSAFNGVDLKKILDNYIEYEWMLEEQSEWEIKKFAGKLKQVASLLTGIPIEKFEDQEFKKEKLGPEWNVHGIPLTHREFLQILGTNALRECLHTNTWVNALMCDYTPLSKWIITDVRFPNEAKAIKDKGGIIIRVDRPFCKPINAHASETALDSWNFDYKVGNVSDLVSLAFTVEGILIEQKLLTN
jgi:hypothetical protein